MNNNADLWFWRKHTPELIGMIEKENLTIIDLEFWRSYIIERMEDLDEFDRMFWEKELDKTLGHYRILLSGFTSG